MEFDAERVRENVQKATTRDLLDRVTVFRAALEPEALTIIGEELRDRGVQPVDIVEHEQKLAGVVLDEQGVARECVYCQNPAIVEEMHWHRLFGKLPLFPRSVLVCADHRRYIPTTDDEPSSSCE